MYNACRTLSVEQPARHYVQCQLGVKCAFARRTLCIMPAGQYVQRDIMYNARRTLSVEQPAAHYVQCPPDNTCNIVIKYE